MFLTFFSLLFGSYLFIFLFQLASWQAEKKNCFGPIRSLFSLTTEKNQQIIDWKTSETWTKNTGLMKHTLLCTKVMQLKKILVKTQRCLKIKMLGQKWFQSNVTQETNSPCFDWQRLPPWIDTSCWLLLKELI